MTTSIAPQQAGSGREIFGRFTDHAPVGDVIPFFDGSEYHLFCLTPPDGALHFPERMRTTWRHLRSADLVHWEQLPDALAPGGDGEPDRDGIWTGSVLRTGEVLHSFYTGHTLALERVPGIEAVQHLTGAQDRPGPDAVAVRLAVTNAWCQRVRQLLPVDEISRAQAPPRRAHPLRKVQRPVRWGEAEQVVLAAVEERDDVTYRGVIGEPAQISPRPEPACRGAMDVVTVLRLSYSRSA